MNNELAVSTVDYNGDSVRSFIDRNGMVWVCLSDVAAVLGIDNPHANLRRKRSDGALGIDPMGIHTVYTVYTPTSGGRQALVFINEPNFYRMVLRSRKPQARAFEKWVTETLLPTVRKSLLERAGIPADKQATEGPVTFVNIVANNTSANTESSTGRAPTQNGGNLMCEYADEIRRIAAITDHHEHATAMHRFARTYGIPVCTAYRWEMRLRRIGVLKPEYVGGQQRRRARERGPGWELIRMLADLGATPREVADVIRCSKTTANRVLAKPAPVAAETAPPDCMAPQMRELTNKLGQLIAAIITALERIGSAQTQSV